MSDKPQTTAWTTPSRRVEAATLAYSFAIAKRGEPSLVRFDDMERALRAADFVTDFVDPGMS